MRGTFFGCLRTATSKLLGDQRGNAMMLTAAAIVPVIGIVGSAIDIGRAYMTQLRLQQACDAGVLAGRRAMAAGLYDDADKAEATKMFSFNFPTGIYGSRNVAFVSVAEKSDVNGTASAILPTAMMYIFGKTQFNLAVACTAKLEISNVDVMMVLDVTGSMKDKATSSDTDTKIVALRKSAIAFFDTLTNADVGDGRLRFGVVPYSSTANVGRILLAKNPAWLADESQIPSRSPKLKPVYSNPQTVDDTNFTNGTTTFGTWTAVNSTSYNQTQCGNQTPPADTTPTASGQPSLNQTGQYVNSDGNRITTYDNSQVYRYYTHRYRWIPKNGKVAAYCELQRSTATFTRTHTTTVTETPTLVFDNKYTYENRTIPVGPAKLGNPIVLDTGDSGTNYSVTWGGCVRERHTVPFASNETAPSDAFDMDIDSAPTSDPKTQWQILVPEHAFPRASGPGSKPSSTNGIVVNSSDVSSDSTTNGSWQRYSKYWSNGWGVCPAAAMKLTTMTKTDKTSFSNYINALQPLGGTYHDAGMVWGARLISPTGILADENGPYRDRPVSRHIVFMTDGDMAPNMGNLSFQGYEWTAQRIGATDDAELTKRHNNRFVQLCRAARERGITVWVVSFGVGSNANLNSCASSGQAFEAANAAQLNSQFQAIARQISKLRLSK
jgi:Flp pilus assembly protein TadG